MIMEMSIIIISNQEGVNQMDVPLIIAYITVGYLFVTLTLLSLLSMHTFPKDKRVGKSRKDLRIFKENEGYRKAA